MKMAAVGAFVDPGLGHHGNQQTMLGRDFLQTVLPGKSLVCRGHAIGGTVVDFILGWAPFGIAGSDLDAHLGHIALNLAQNRVGFVLEGGHNLMPAENGLFGFGIEDVKLIFVPTPA